MRPLTLRIGRQFYLRAGTYLPKIVDGAIVLERIETTAERLKAGAVRSRRAARAKRKGA